MRRLLAGSIAVGVVMALAASVGAGSALADRPARGSQKRAIKRAFHKRLAQDSGVVVIPKTCYRLRVRQSTVGKRWAQATMTWRATHAHCVISMQQGGGMILRRSGSNRWKVKSVFGPSGPSSCTRPASAAVMSDLFPVACPATA